MPLLAQEEQPARESRARRGGADDPRRAAVLHAGADDFVHGPAHQGDVCDVLFAGRGRGEDARLHSATGRDGKPAVLVIHESRGRNPISEDVARGRQRKTCTRTSIPTLRDRVQQAREEKTCAPGAGCWRGLTRGCGR
jgi:hypothetical protein